MTDLLKAENFLPHVDKVFRVKGSSHALTLVQVDHRQRQESERLIGARDPFNLIFRGPPGNVLREGLYLLEVENGTSFELYVMPIHTPLRDRQDYQASFN